MGKSQRVKGAAGEREAAKALNETIGGEWRRGFAQTRRGGKEEPDIVSDNYPEVHVEVKRGKRNLNLWGALKQAKDDTEDSHLLPIVMARRDQEKWVVMFELHDLLELADILHTTVRLDVSPRKTAPKRKLPPRR